jgi:hypothetical protein
MAPSMRLRLASFIFLRVASSITFTFWLRYKSHA